MKAIIIGRHKLSGEEGLEVIAQENINFPAESQECVSVLEDLAAKAVEAKAQAVVFQAIPGQVAVCLHKVRFLGLQVGAIINKPEEGSRPAGLVKKFYDEDTDSLEEESDLTAAVKFVNPRANIELKMRPDWRYGRIVEVTVDPPMRFKFSHIEWL